MKGKQLQSREPKPFSKMKQQQKDQIIFVWAKSLSIWKGRSKEEVWFVGSKST